MKFPDAATLIAKATLDSRSLGGSRRGLRATPTPSRGYFCVMMPTESLDPAIHEPEKALTVVRDALEATYLGKVAEPQNRSVNIEFSGTGIAYDVVPAFVDASSVDEVFLIPDIDVNVVVVEGTTASALRAGAGHYPDTPLPCEVGNVDDRCTPARRHRDHL